jgi:hypothetical protein
VRLCAAQEMTNAVISVNLIQHKSVSCQSAPCGLLVFGVRLVKLLLCNCTMFGEMLCCMFFYTKCFFSFLLCSVHQHVMKACKKELSRVSQHPLDVIVELSLETLEYVTLECVQDGIQEDGVKYLY